VKERRQPDVQVPRIATLPEPVNDRLGDGVPVLLRESAGPALGLDAPEREGQRVHKLIGSGLQRGHLRFQKGPVIMEASILISS
jgi:hypothetical protein